MVLGLITVLIVLSGRLVVAGCLALVIVFVETTTFGWFVVGWFWRWFGCGCLLRFELLGFALCVWVLMLVLGWGLLCFVVSCRGLWVFGFGLVWSLLGFTCSGLVVVGVALRGRLIVYMIPYLMCLCCLGCWT